MRPNPRLVDTSLVGMVSDFLSKGGRWALPIYEMHPKEEKPQVWVFCQIIFVSDGSLCMVGLFLDC